NYLPSILKVTSADVQRVARKYFEPDTRIVVWSVPKGGNKEQGARNRNGTILARSASEGTGTGHSFSLTDAKRVVLPNGMVLLLLENHRLPIVVIEASIRHVSLLEPEDKAGLATLTRYLLDEGTKAHTGSQITESN